jgi:hypothetical protein
MLPRIAPLGGRHDAIISPRMDARSSEAAGQFILGIPPPPARFALYTKDERFLRHFLLDTYELDFVSLCEFARESGYSSCCLIQESLLPACRSRISFYPIIRNIN